MKWTKLKKRKPKDAKLCLTAMIDFKSQSSLIVHARTLKSGDFILKSDGKFSEIQGAYPASGTYFVQFKDGMGWHCPEDGRVFILKRPRND